MGGAYHWRCWLDGFDSIRAAKNPETTNTDFSRMCAADRQR